MAKKMLILLFCAGHALLFAQPVLLKDYHPASSLVVPVTHVQRARFPAIDFHAHSAFNGATREAVDQWVRMMDESGVETAIVYTDAIGAALGISTATVRSTLHRALAQLKGILG